MYRRIYSIATIILLLVVFIGCKTSEPAGPINSNEQVYSVVFLFAGAVVPHPTSTLITVDVDKIKSVSSQEGVALSSWSSKIQNQEYDRLISIITNNKLLGAPDPISGRQCVGSRGMSVIIKNNNIVDTITISGLYMCDKSCWPVGLDSLVAFQDSLVSKYKQ
jgi:hypothetical protein